MKRAAIFGAALALIILIVIAGAAFAIYFVAQSQAASNLGPYRYGRGMGPGMMDNLNTQPGGLVPVNPTAPAPQPNATTLPTSSNSSALPANAATQKTGNLNVTLAMTPYPPVSFQQTTFDITITDAEGAAVSDAKVSLDLTMPSMWMPTNKPQAQSLGAGKYQAIGRFTMRGGWQIAVIIERGSEKQTAYFQLGL